MLVGLKWSEGAGIVQTVKGVVKSWMVQGSDHGRGTRPDQPQHPPTLLQKGYVTLSLSRRHSGRGVALNHPPSSDAFVAYYRVTSKHEYILLEHSD